MPDQSPHFTSSATLSFLLAILWS